MLEKPALPDALIINCLRDAYGLTIADLAFLPLGADRNTAVYRAETDAGVPYFVKLRRGDFHETTIHVPKLLHDQGIRHIIAPLPTQTGALWTPLDKTPLGKPPLGNTPLGKPLLDEWTLVVFPYVEGRNGYEVALTDPQWIALGAVIRALHQAALPQTVLEQIPSETFSPRWRETVQRFMTAVDTTAYHDSVAAEMAAFLGQKRETIQALVRQAERLATVLAAAPPRFVLCHADIHAGNALITPDGMLYVVDWDTLILAPKERDLMYAGGGLFGGYRSPEDEEALFYRGYGEVQMDPVALAYYRYERIVQDVAEFCEQILLTEGDSEDRAEGLRLFTGQFQPGQVVEIAFRSERLLPPELQLAADTN